MRSRPVLTMLAVLALGLAVGMAFMLNRVPGIDAEVVAGPAGPVLGDSATVTLCAAPANGLLGRPGSPASAVVLISRATELIDQRKRSPARFQPEDLLPGSYIQIWATEPATPPADGQPTLIAARIALISDPVEGRPSLCEAAR